MKILLTILLVALLAVGVGYWTWRGAAGDRPQFRTLPVTRGDVRIGVSATGTVEPVEIVDVGAEISGMIKSIGPDREHPVDYNSRVKKGDILAQLDDLPYKAALQNAVAGLRLAEAEVQQDQAQLEQAEHDFNRFEKLRATNPGAVSPSDYDKAKSQYEIDKAVLAMAKAKVEQAQVAKRQAEINLEYTTINSPVDGTVIARKCTVGQTVIAQLNAPSLFLLAKDSGRMLVYAAVNEADVGDIHEGQKVTFKVDAYTDHVFTGKVFQIRNDASLVGGVVTYRVVVDVDNTDGKLRPYMTAKLQFQVALASDVLQVPDQALRWQPTWEQISPSARAGLPSPAPHKSRPGDDKEAESESDEPTVEMPAPTVWVRATTAWSVPCPSNWDCPTAPTPS